MFYDPSNIKPSPSVRLDNPFKFRKNVKIRVVVKIKLISF